jgi:hypothetical protein
MKERNYLKPGILLCLLLILLSAFFYALRYVIFQDAYEIFGDLLDDIGFVFIEILLASVIIHQILTEWARRSIRRKLHMVIGAFFSEVGTTLMEYFGGFDRNAEAISHHLRVKADWSPEHFNRIRSVLKKHHYDIDSRTGDLAGLRTFLIEKRPFLLRLLENPNLLEHEEFTKLLWAVFHLSEELSCRKGVADLPEADYRHLSEDIHRAAVLVVDHWLSRMEYLKTDYPYLFSFAVRTNPFDPNASVELNES